MIDLEELERLAKAAGGGQWTASDGTVWFDDGDSALRVMNPVPAFIAHDNLGTWPDPIAAEDVAAFAASANPAVILALIAEVRALREDSADWKRRWQDAVDHASEAIAERNHWQANHDNQVARARFLIERGDIPVERVRTYGLMGALLELEEAIRHDREIFADTSDEHNPTGTLVTKALEAIDAARAEEKA